MIPAPNSPLVLDHVVALGMAVVFPGYAALTYPKLRAALRANEPGARRRDYTVTMLWLWGLGIAAVGAWILDARPLAELGMGLSAHWGFWLGLTATAGVAGLLAVQLNWVRTDPRARAAAQQQFASVEEYLPRSRSEMRLFAALSATAGICEEVLYRGFLIWYLRGFTALAGAVVISSLVFGMAHICHGKGAAARATVIGGILAGLYLLTGSLWLPMAVHALIDMHAGLTSRAIHATRSDMSG